MTINSWGFLKKKVKINNTDMKILCKIKELIRMYLVNYMIDEWYTEMYGSYKMNVLKIIVFELKWHYYSLKNVFWVSSSYQYLSAYIKLLFDWGPYMLFCSRLGFYLYNILVGIIKFFILIFFIMLVIFKYLVYLIILFVIMLKFIYRFIILSLECIALLKFFVLHVTKLVRNFFAIKVVEIFHNFNLVSVGERNWSFENYRNMDMHMSYTYNDRFSMYDILYDHVELDIEMVFYAIVSMDMEMRDWVLTLDDDEFLWPMEYVEDDNKTSLMDMFMNYELKDNLLSFYEESLELYLYWDDLEYEVGYMLGINKIIGLGGKIFGLDKLKSNFMLYSFWTRDTLFYNYSYNLLFFESLRSLGVLDNILGLGDLQNETAYALHNYYSTVYTANAHERTAVGQEVFEEDSDSSEVNLFEEYINKVWLTVFSEEGLDNAHNFNGRRLPDFLYGIRLYELVDFFRISRLLNFVWYLDHIKLKVLKLNMFSILNFRLKVFIYKIIINVWFNNRKN